MTKPILYLMLLTGGAFAAGAGVVTFSEWQAARQSAAPVAAVEPPRSEAAPGDAPPAEEPPASAEESLTTPLAPPPASAPVATRPASPESEVAAVSPQPERDAAEERPQAPPAPAGSAAPDMPSAPPQTSPSAPSDRPQPLAEPSAPAADGEDAPVMPGAANVADEPSPTPQATGDVAVGAVEAPETPPQPAAPQPSDSAALQPEESPAAPVEPEASPQRSATAAVPPEEAAAAQSAPSVPPEAEPAESAPAAPAFDIVRVEPTGEAVIAGKAPRGSKVQIMSNEEVVAETSTDEGGNWVALPERPLRPGSHDLTIRAVNEDGAETKSEQHVAIAVPEQPGEEVVAVLGAPGRASEILAGPSRETPAAAAQPPQKLDPVATAGEVAELRPPALSVDAVEAEGRNMFVAGAGDPGALVRVYVDGDLVGEAEAGAGGRWLIEATRSLEEGEVTVRADQIEAGTAQVEARAEVPFTRRPDMAALVPAAQAEAGGGDSAAGEALPAPAAVIIRRGDNLWTISRRTYGRGVRYTTIYGANEDQIRDPHWIYPGQVFVLPTRDRAWSER